MEQVWDPIGSLSILLSIGANEPVYVKQLNDIYPAIGIPKLDCLD